jgi:hypothetical protein
MCICITIESKSLRYSERSKVEKDTKAVSFSSAAGMDFLCLEKDLVEDRTAVHLDEVVIEAGKDCSDPMDCREGMDWNFMDWTLEAEESSSDFMDCSEGMDWMAVVEMEVHCDDEMEFEVEEGEDEDKETYMDFD